jgi:putative spermidine/putrescine transport system substrate-binding protein
MAIINAPTKSSTDVSRRQALKSISQAIVGVTAVTQALYVFAKQRSQLKALGTHVTLQKKLRQKVMEHLNVDLIFEARGIAAVLQKASINPQSFDLCKQWSNSIRPVWASRSIQPIDKKRLQYWDEINSLSKTGKITSEASEVLKGTDDQISVQQGEIRTGGGNYTQRFSNVEVWTTVIPSFDYSLQK